MSRGGPTPMAMLFPSGEDANPLNRRLPAEVITRQRRPVKKVEEKPSEDVVVDLKTALSWKPDNRPKWLARAFRMAEEGRASTTDLYDIIASRKFASGMPLKVARRLREMVNENVELFSDKQRRHLKSEEWIINAKYSEKGEREGEVIGQEGQEQDDVADMEPDTADDKGASQPSALPPPSRQPTEGAAPSMPSAAPAQVPPVTPSQSSSLPPASERAVISAPAPAPLPQPSASKQTGVVASPVIALSSSKIATKTGPPVQLEDLERPKWSEAPAARGQQERLRREVLLAEERARKKAQEKEEQERWLVEEAEASSRRAQEQQQAQRRRLEDEVDSSMMLLERLGQQQQYVEEKREERKSDRQEKRGHKHGLSRSRSISVKRSRSRRKRRRRRSPSEPVDRASFADALSRRLAEREKSDTTRIPVVDPGHAQRPWR